MSKTGRSNLTWSAPNFGSKVALASLSLSLVTGSAAAQSVVELEHMLAQLEAAVAGQDVVVDARRRAGIAAVPSGFGLSGGVVSFSLSGSHGKRRGGPGSERTDASTSIAIGFGDPIAGLAFEIGIVNTSFRNFGASGFLTLGVNRQFSYEGGTGSIALTANNINGWGDSRGLSIGVNLVASSVYSISGMPAMGTLGIGSQLGSRSASTGNQKAGIIAGFGLGVAQDWAVSAGIVAGSPVIGASYFPAALSGSSVNISLRDFDRSDSVVFGVDIGFALNVFGG